MWIQASNPTKDNNLVPFITPGEKFRKTYVGIHKYYFIKRPLSSHKPKVIQKILKSIFSTDGTEVK